jgi:hypothetical protein
MLFAFPIDTMSYLGKNDLPYMFYYYQSDGFKRQEKV